MSEPTTTIIDLASAVALTDADLAFATEVIRGSGFVSEIAFERDPKYANPFAPYGFAAFVRVPAEASALTIMRATGFVRGVFAAVEATRVRKAER